ncbi:MAG: polysaccharide deacetylase family protein [Kiritimatiellia bacterium]
MKNPIPFIERDSFWREKAELAAGKWPSFVFGFGKGKGLPLFRFSRVTRQELEPCLIYLMENGYRTVQAAEMEEILQGKRTPGPREVGLCFDHAWASLWTVAAPLLERYDFRAVVYAIPGRIPDLETVRPVWGQQGHDPAVDFTDTPFCSWLELKILQERGRVDVQSNSWSHGKIFSHDKFLKLVLPETNFPYLSWPLINDPGEKLRFLSRSHVFHPILPMRSRLSDGLRHVVDNLVVKAIHDDPDAAPFLFKKYFLQIETEAEREAAIRHELLRSREELEKRLGKPVQQICFPWGVCGKVAAGLLEECGYRSAVAERTAGKLYLQPGQDPFRIGRLPYPYIRALPGRPRKLYLRIHQAEARQVFS